MRFLLNLIFPPKCILCRKVLEKRETDLCHHCRTHVATFTKSKSRIPFVARWTSLWYYKEEVRSSIHRYKFGRSRNYASAYGRLLAVHLLQAFPDDFDLVSWVPTGTLRKLKRGYDHAKLLAEATARELGIEATPVLKKIRNNPPQSSIPDAAKRRANVSGAYRILEPEAVNNKRVLLLDDVITTGATCSECARMLMTAGAKEVYCAAVAAASHEKK